MTPEERVLEAYYDRLRSSRSRSRASSSIDFQSADPDLAAAVANAIAEAYLARQQAAKQQQTRAAGQWLAGEIDIMRKKVADAEAKVEEFRAKSNLLCGTNNTTLSSQTAWRFQRAARRRARAEGRCSSPRRKLIRDMLQVRQPGRILRHRSIPSSSAGSPSSGSRLRAQLAEQSSTLLGNHPRIKELKAQIADLDEQISGEADCWRVRSRTTPSSPARASIRFSRKPRPAQAARRRRPTSKTSSCARSSAKPKSQRDLLESYLAKYREATARDNINVGAGRRAHHFARQRSRTFPPIRKSCRSC